MVSGSHKEHPLYRKVARHKRRPVISSEFLENLMKTNEKTSTSQVSCPKGSSVQEGHTPYHPEPPCNSPVRNVRQKKKKSNIARGLISVKPAAGNVLYCYVGVELKKLPGSISCLAVHRKGHLKIFRKGTGTTLWRSSEINALAGEKAECYWKEKDDWGTPWKLLEEVIATMNLHPLAK